MGRKAANKRRLRSIASRDGLRIVIATTPTSNSSGADLSYDLQLIRSALLYADQVELISPGVTMVEGVRQIHRGGPDALLALIASLDGDALAWLGGGNSEQLQFLMHRVSEYQGLNRQQKRNLSEETRGQYEALLTNLRTLVSGSDMSGLELQASTAELLEIDEALDSGLLTINHDVTYSMMADEKAGEMYGAVLRDRIMQGSSLLLDDQVGNVVRAMIHEDD